MICWISATSTPPDMSSRLQLQERPSVSGVHLHYFIPKRIDDLVATLLIGDVCQ